LKNGEMMYYEYYKNICVCDGREIYLPLRRLDGSMISGFPVTVYNVNEVAIGTANNKEQYLNIWNADLANRAVGVLTGLIGPFSFTLITKSSSPPDFVIGESTGVVAGIFTSQFTSQFN